MSQTQSSHTSTGTTVRTTTAAPAPAPKAAALPVWQLAPINPLEPPFYLEGVPSSMIIAAATDAEARAIASAGAGPHDAEAWSDEAMSSCDPLAPEVAGVIARDFSPAPPPPAAAETATPPVNVDVPHVSGSGVAGQTLSCTMGNWEGMQDEPASYAYAWATDGAPNAGIEATYWVAPSDVGHEITCVVTATNAAGSTAAPPSNAIAIA